MGLDMYLDKFPRVGKVTPRVICAVEELENWKEHGNGCSLEEWCGVDESELPEAETIALLESYRHISFAAWDDEQKYPNNQIHEIVGYWRKANAIHLWFVSHIQDGIDDCDWHREVTKRDLEKLRDDCATVLNEAVLVRGKVTNGWRGTKDGLEPIVEDGLVVLDTEICEDVLPTRSGFFFGNTEYNEWYIGDVQKTYDLCQKLLKETDFEHYALYYCSSW